MIAASRAWNVSVFEAREKARRMSTRDLTMWLKAAAVAAGDGGSCGPPPAGGFAAPMRSQSLDEMAAKLNAFAAATREKFA